MLQAVLADPSTLAKPRALLFISALATTAVLRYVWDQLPGMRKQGMPPGPRTYPIVGNIFNLKSELSALHAEYGDIISFKIGDTTMISLAGDGTPVHELLDKRGAIYSNRPYNALVSIATKDDHQLFQTDTDKWRIGRKHMVQHLAANVMAKPERVAIQEAESVQLLQDCSQDPDNLAAYVMRYTTSVITCLTYGVRCETTEDPAVHIEKIMRYGIAIKMPGLPGFPFLNGLPEFLSPWRAQARKLGQMMDSLYGGLLGVGQQRGVNGLNTETLAYKLLTGEEHTGMSRHHQAYICGIVLEGGSDIVAAVIMACILALIHDPKAQARARAEIDSIYDQETLPTWLNQRSLPFLRAVIKETLRWRPPVPVAIPHRLERDDYYRGYFLPKDSIVLCNSLAIHMNPKRFDEPENFKPERYLGYDASMQDYVSQGDPLKRDHFTFGAGRRVCPGIQTAEQSLFIGLSRLLWAFEFSAPPGTTPSMDRNTAFHTTGIRSPLQFPVAVTPRSEERFKAVERELASAKEVYARYGVYREPFA